MIMYNPSKLLGYMNLLNISAKNHYGMIIMCALADLWGTDDYLSLKEIADSMDLSAKFLEEISADLKSQGLVESKRGSYGGYRLARDPKKITVKDIVEAIEGKTRTIACQEGTCPMSGLCTSKNFWLFLEDSLDKTLSNTTLYQALHKL